jgi:hypothetical protein
MNEGQPEGQVVEKLEWLEPTIEVLHDPETGSVMLPTEGTTHIGNVFYGPTS